ncbi:MAG: hydroxymethylbilane synthase [Alphaproteobacteria bacterium]|jgi:hydroxymethylbilane synthase|nr:hydroxymethylbilane synthase [Alphaproteobacteria bacterium]MCB1550684.1 hydroxymethylbilane synthase [Alphaproteobacteria bacterium]MCB9985349.1 hydroxymethylbilane synthase [Micavibrio sp.]HPQ51248.1 hydroxymethylbilane synthase [Alphaproteobacteria bacterium]HRK98129.1 hydroxymethylbilane synthase [Alphaproteobacteria bacterium]
MLKKLRIGTRGSLLALTQAHMVVDALRAAHSGLDVEIVEILTSGDWKPAQGETRLMEAKGGKGQFAHEIEQRILAGDIDCGVHSLKDMPSFLPEGLKIEHFLPREDARDAFISVNYKSLEDMPAGSVVGTSSLRRQAFLLAKFPHLKVLPIRGNVPTRLEKLAQGQVDATFLALAGLKRLDLESHVTCILEPSAFLPACGQGIVGIETRSGDADVLQVFSAISCFDTTLVAIAERAALQVLDGSCHTPVGAYAELAGGRMTLRVAVAKPDGTEFFEDVVEGPVVTLEDARTMGQVVGHRLKPRLPEGIL